MLRQFQRLLVSPMISPSDRWRRRYILVGVLNVDFLVFVLVLIVAYPMRVRIRSWTRTKTGRLTLIVHGTGRSRKSGRIVTYELTDHPEGARFPFWLLRYRLVPIDPLGSVEAGVPGCGISDNRAERATFAAHAGDGAAGRTLADFHSGRSGVRLLRLRLRLRRWWWRWWWRAL